EKLEAETIQWCEEILEKSPTALRFLKASFNADTDGLAGLQQMGGDATLLYYTTDEAEEGRDAFKEKRKPDFKQFPRFPKEHYFREKTFAVQRFFLSYEGGFNSMGETIPYWLTKRAQTTPDQIAIECIDGTAISFNKQQ